MSQLYLKFPFKKNYLERDFYVSSSNYEAYKLIDNYPNWPGSKINLYGPSGCGKTYLANILDKKVSLIIANTVKGKGISFMENEVVWHHKVPSEEQYNLAQKELEKLKININND